MLIEGPCDMCQAPRWPRWAQGSWPRSRSPAGPSEVLLGPLLTPCPHHSFLHFIQALLLVSSWEAPSHTLLCPESCCVFPRSVHSRWTFCSTLTCLLPVSPLFQNVGSVRAEFVSIVDCAIPRAQPYSPGIVGAQEIRSRKGSAPVFLLGPGLSP